MFKTPLFLFTCLCLQFVLNAQPPANSRPPIFNRNTINEIRTLNTYQTGINQPLPRLSKTAQKRGNQTSNSYRTSSQPCLDTSKRLLLREDTAWVSNDPITKTADNNILIPGFHYLIGETATVPHLMKCSPDGKILWSKSYYKKGVYPSRYFNTYYAKELINGDIIFIGSMAIRMPVNGRDELGVMRLTATGDLRWGRTFKCKMWKDTTSGSVNVADVKEDASGNIYLAGSQGNYSNSTHTFVFKLDKNGRQQWDKNFLTYAGTYGINLINNELVLTGAYSDNNHYNVFFARLKLQTGDTIATKAFTPDYYNYFDSHRSFMSSANTIMLANGNLAVYGTAFSDLDTYNRQDTIRHSNIAYFTPQLEFIDGVSLSSGQHSNYYSTRITPDAASNRISFTRTFYKSGYNSDILYGTIVNNQVIKERLYQQRNRSNPFTSNFLHFGGNEDVITQYYGDSIKNLTGIEFIRLHDTDTAGYCTGIDTSLSFLEPFNMKHVNVYLSMVDTSTFVETYRAIANGVNTEMIKETGCEQVSFCDSLSIHTANDTICTNSPILITATRNKECGSGITWNFSDATSGFKKINDTTIQVVFTQPWQGKVYGKISGCTDLIDSLSITVLPALGQVNLGPDSSICPANKFTIHAGKGYKNYVWNNGSSDSTLTVSTAGTYSVIATNACGNIFKDTIVIKPAAPIPFSVGPDVSKCNSDTVTLKAPAGFIAYSWSPGYNILATDTAIVRVYPSKDYIYTVRAEKTPGCYAYDTIRVTVNTSPKIHLGADTTLCDDKSITLNAGDSFTNYKWSTGSTASSIVVNKTGFYSVVATALNNCISVDTISVTVKTTPVFSLGSDTLICANERLVLQPQVSGNFEWQDRTTGKQQIVSAAGLYWLKVTSGICAFTDSITIAVKPLPVVTLPPDTTICNTATLVLTVTQPGATYQWNDGEVKNSKIVDAAGTYSVIVTKNGCQGRDTINVVHLQSPVFNLGRDTTLCTGDVYTLHAGFLNANYRWQDNTKSTEFDVKQAGTYFVTGSNYCGTYSDSVKISTIQCSCSLNIANSFSPNNDGINDLFKPDLLCTPVSYKLSIFNRYGALLFDGSNYNSGWNGRFNDTDVPVGTYYYVLQVQGPGDVAPRKKAGSVTLLR
ncbi:MAG: hypothetical protein JWQ09_3448 [Segetibacter sp.]|nr:hypothetical protein [Segetibacter sp.]